MQTSGLAQAFATLKSGCPALLAFFARGAGLLYDVGRCPDPKKKNQAWGVPLLASDSRPFYRDCQRLGLRLPWKQAIATIRCS